MKMYKNNKKYVGTVSNGEARILQDPESDVSLQISEGSKGVFMTHVQTGPTRPINMIPHEECLISPTVEVEHNRDDECLSKPHIITIPHCIQDSELWQFIKVRRINHNKKGQFELIQAQQENNKLDEYYRVEKGVIYVFARNFSEFTCTICKRSCSADIRTFIFGKIEDNQEVNLTSVKIRAFMCSELYRIKDFENVS